MSFAEKLRELREAAQLSQAELAASAGVPIGTVQGYEQGRRLPLLPVLFKLSRALGVDCSAFAACDEAGGEPEPPPAAPKRKKPGAG